MEINLGTKELEAIETPVLVAWARRCVRLAEQTPNAYKPHVEVAANHLRVLETHIENPRPPETVQDEEDDFGGVPITFSRETQAWGVCEFTARAILHVEEIRKPDGVSRMMNELFSDLTRNIGVEA